MTNSPSLWGDEYLDDLSFKRNHGPVSNWKPPQALPEWDVRGRPFAFDLETKDEGLAEDWGAGWAAGKGRVVGVAAATPGQPGVYLPFGHPEDNGPYDQAQVARWLDRMLADCSVAIGHNVGYDIGWSSTQGVRLPDRVFDTQVAAALLDENRRDYGLDAVALSAGLEGKDTDLFLRAAEYYRLGKSKRAIMSNLWRLPARYVGPYAEGDAEQALALFIEQAGALDNIGMQELVDVEMDMVRLAFKMRQRGIRVDLDHAEQLNKQWIADQTTIEKKIHEICGLHIKPDNPDDLKRLCDLIGVFDIPTTPKTKDLSFTNKWMATLHHDAFDWIVKWRNIQHSRKNYVEGIVLSQSVAGRVYPEINTVKRDDGGTVSGRISINNPALQQVSARNPVVGPPVRACFIPEDGETWGAFDYSQQEPRLAVHFAALLRIAGASDAVEYYRNDPSADFHAMMSELSGQPRKVAKNIFLGMCYGMGNDKLADELGVTVPETISVRDGFDRRVPWVSRLSDECTKRAGSRGYIKTLLKRRCRFGLFEPYGKEPGRVPLPWKEAQAKWPNQSLRRAFIYKAMNRLIQGSAADQTKKAMVDMFREGIVPMLQMHDELDVSLPEPDGPIRARVEEIMLHSAKLMVPSKVDVGLGRNWGEAE